MAKPYDIAIIGAGAMGLAAAYHALKDGHKVTVYEADTVPGGMAAHFDFDGISLERFYHFVCKTDYDTFELMEELGISKKMKWVPTSMGYFIEGKHYNWGDPISLLTFPLLGIIDKFRYGLTMFLVTKKKSLDHLEHVSAKDWILNACGEKVYKLLWDKLFYLKFFEFSDNISASWIATRIKRIGSSRKSIMQEELGYIDGGSEALVKALCDKITELGGTIKLGQPTKKVVIEKNKVKAIETPSGETKHDKVISTVPLSLVNKMIPDLTQEWKDNIDSINNIGCVCVVIKLKKKLTKHFWLNINDKKIDIPGLVEFSNLRDFGKDHIVYLPYYMPQTHEKFFWSDDKFVEEAKKYIKAVNNTIKDSDIKSIKIGRLRYAQPVCEPGFKDKLLPTQTPIEGLQVADTCYYYPEDRGISESVKIAKQMVKDLLDEK